MFGDIILSTTQGLGRGHLGDIVVPGARGRCIGVRVRGHTGCLTTAGKGPPLYSTSSITNVLPE